jgi:hypothetical protein
MSELPNGLPKEPKGLPKEPNGLPKEPNGLPKDPNGLPKDPNGLPSEIQQYILEFIQPYLTRDDWQTCRSKESKIMSHLIEQYKRGKPRNDSHPVHYKHWTFYEQVRFGTIDTPLFPRGRLTFSFKMRRIPYFF